MKKLITMLLIFSVTFAFAEKLTFKFDFAEPQLKQKKEHVVLTIKNTLNQGIPGHPLQPFFAETILLPPGAELVSATINASSTEQFQLKHDILPAQYAQPLSVGTSGLFVKNQDVYNTTCALSFENSLTTNVEIINGLKVVQVKFSPIEYNPAKKSFVFAKDVEITIEYKSNKQVINPMVSSRPEVKERIASIVANPELISQYSAKAKGELLDALVITPDSFIEDFDELTSDYLLRGYSTVMLSTEEINSSYDGTDLPEKIRNAIIDYYQNHDIMYVLLGGDVELVPYRGFFCQVQSSSVYTDENIPADLYYSALDGSWDENNNGLYGEPEEDDLLPEVAVSRMPFSTVQDLENMLNKNLTYTNSPVTGELTKPLLVGEHLYDDPLTWGAQYLDLIHGTHDDNGYTTSGIPESHPYETMYDRDATWSQSQLISKMNEGHPFIHHVGHSNSNYTMRLYNSDITNSNFNQLDGVQHNYNLIYTHGCICGAFDENDCIAEEMLKIENMAVAFIGNSRYGWFNEGQTEGPSGHLHREFVDAVYNDGLYNLAEAHLMSKIASSEWVEAPDQWEFGAIRWVFYDCNALGNPLLPIWTEEPITVDIALSEELYLSSTTCELTVSVDGAGKENTNVAVIKDGILYGSGTTDASGNCSVDIFPAFPDLGNVEIVVSGYNIAKQTQTVELNRPPYGYLFVGDIFIENPQYGQTYSPSVNLENLGESGASPAELTISTECPYIELSSEPITTPTMPALGTLQLDGAFTMDVSNTIEDGTPIDITFTFTRDGEMVSENTLIMNASAPKLTIDDMYINDTLAGNGNGILEMGEVGLMTIAVRNDGSVSPQLTKNVLFTNSTDIIVYSDTVSTSVIEGNSTKLVQFAIAPSENAESGSIVELSFAGTYDSYNLAEASYSFILGEAIDNFESGDFSLFNWDLTAQYPWEISTEAYEGSYCAVSAGIDHDQESTLTIAIDVAEQETISFNYKVSSEETYDFFRFYIDGNEMDSWSGEIDWQFASYNVSAGNHTFTWKYEKDFTVSDGSDCAWIDNVKLPVPANEPPEDNSAPVITSSPENILLLGGETFNYVLTANDENGDALSAELLVAPTWISIDGYADQEWMISGTAPLVGEQLPQVVVSVTDGIEYVAQAFSINIDGVDIAENENTLGKIKVYPQPAYDKLNIVLPQNIDAGTIQLFSIDGKMLNQINIEKYPNTSFQLDINGMDTGMYILTIRSSNDTFVQKIMIE